MPTAKARYAGNGAFIKIPDFSDDLKKRLRDFYPDKEAKTDPTWGSPADVFVSNILAEAWWAKSELHWQSFDLTKPEIRAEHADLLKVLKVAQSKVRSLSPDFDRLLGIDADPRGCADEISRLISRVEHAGDMLNSQPDARRTAEKHHEVAIGMAVRILCALMTYKIKPSGTASSYLPMADITEIRGGKKGDEATRYVSDAVLILKAVGDDLGLVLAESTWRDIIIEAKKTAPELQ